jgi:diguanylate cyclase (GGDEF)-like protein
LEDHNVSIHDLHHGNKVCNHTSMSEKNLPSTDIPKPPAPPEDWSDLFNLTEEQITYIYGQFPGFNDAARRLLFNSIRAISKERNKAQTDPLTELGNRASMKAWADEHYKPTEKTYIAIALDLNYFKALNDTFGHGAGDSALVVFSQKLLSTFRFKPRETTGEDARKKYYSEDGLFVRPGGDEFVVVLPIDGDGDVVSITKLLAGRIDENLRVDYEDIESELHASGQENFTPVTAKSGIAVTYVDNPISFEALLKEADMKLREIASSR